MENIINVLLEPLELSLANDWPLLLGVAIILAASMLYAYFNLPKGKALENEALKPAPTDKGVDENALKAIFSQEVDGAFSRVISAIRDESNNILNALAGMARNNQGSAKITEELLDQKLKNLRDGFRRYVKKTFGSQSNAGQATDSLSAEELEQIQKELKELKESFYELTKCVGLAIQSAVDTATEERRNEVAGFKEEMSKDLIKKIHNLLTAIERLPEMKRGTPFADLEESLKEVEISVEMTQNEIAPKPVKDGEESGGTESD